MTKQLLTGSFVALISPMNQDYSLDFGGFRNGPAGRPRAAMRDFMGTGLMAE